MIETRRERDAAQIPVAQQRLASADLESLRRRHTDIESRIAAADASGDVVALGTARERATYAKVEQMEALAADSTEPDAEESRDKIRLIKGVLYWQMHSAYKARAWSARRNDRETLTALHETEGRWAQVKDAIGTVQARDEGFADRVAALRPRMAAAGAEIERLRLAEGDFLAALAVTELTAQRERLSAYLLQARYALATLYDRAANGEPRKPGPGGAAPEAKP